MLKATADDTKLIIELLAQSFGKNESVDYIIRQDERRVERIRALMDYSIEVCRLFGEVWLSEDKKACALILYPHLKKTTLKSIQLDFKLIFRCVGLTNILKVMNREALIKKRQPKEKMSYVWFIGVESLYQHTGIGSKLLTDVIADAVQKNLPIYLETSTLENLPWYKRFGFEVYDKLDLSYTLYFLKYRPAK